MATIEIKGLAALQNRLKKATGNIAVEVAGELKAGADKMVAEAKSNAPGDQGILSNEISNQTIDPLHYNVSSGAAYSPFLEFGTRSKVSIPAGLEEYAAQFKGDFASGTLGAASSLTAWEAIKAWCERQSIDKELWGAIYVSIMVNGIEPQPFFFPALAKVTPEIIDNVRKVLSDI